MSGHSWTPRLPLVDVFSAHNGSVWFVVDHTFLKLSEVSAKAVFPRASGMASRIIVTRVFFNNLQEMTSYWDTRGLLTYKR